MTLSNPDHARRVLEHIERQRKGGVPTPDLRGEIFGRLSVIAPAERGNRGRMRWSVRCECGTEKIVGASELLSGKAQSCGCAQREMIATLGRRTGAANARANTAKAAAARTKHGRATRGSADPTYQTWEAMHQRCTNPRNVKYHRYGGRGIKVCARWQSFENFLVDMGDRPKGRTIDRIDPDGNYEAANCRWATPGEQANNYSQKPFPGSRRAK